MASFGWYRVMAGRALVTAGLLVAFSAAFSVSGQVLPIGAEFQVNTFTTSVQVRPAVAVDAQGRMVVVWESLGSSGTDSSGRSILAQRFDANGLPLGGEFQVNSYTTHGQYAPSVAADGQGNFVVAWESWGSGGTDTSLTSIQAQRFDTDGVPLGSQFQVNTFTLYHQFNAAVAADAQGNFVVVWASWGSSGTDDYAWSIQAQRYDTSGLPLGGEFQVNSLTTGYQIDPAVAADPQGYFVVAWRSATSGGTDTGYGVEARRYDAAGAPLGDEFQVNTYTSGRQQAPAVAADAQGRFVVAWESDGSSGTDTELWSVQAQRYDASGLPLGGEFQVNTYTTERQQAPAVAADPLGRFVVVWESYGSSGTDTSTWSVQGRRYDADGTPLGGEFQVDSYTTGLQWRASAAVSAQGELIVTWQSSGSSGTDTSLDSVQAQRYACAYFYDGFESGDTSRWSESQP